MPMRSVTLYDEQTNITTVSNEFAVNPSSDVTTVVRLVSGTPVSGCRIQYTIDDAERITAGTATWVNSPLGAHLSTSSERMLRPVTGVRLSVTDGVWTFQVRQV